MEQQPLILIIDDEQSILDMLSEVLQYKGYRAMLATNGQEALEMYEADRPDLILLDYLMPVIDAPAFCRLLEQQPGRKPPVVVITANILLAGDPSKRQQLESLGAQAYLHKPFDLSELYEVIERLVNRPQSLQ